MVGEAEALHPVGLGDIAADDDHAGLVGVVARERVKVIGASKAEGVADPSFVTGGRAEVA